ncbi:carboxylesterase [Rhodococcus sp. 06-156-3C]|uniref:carboxylesterase/lipase family protein n=1 Tax=Nocardiaceae TaxID=85025 RepID=UPI000522F5CC|nr:MULTISPECIES: carboxylesterase family protein [Rhodococcus]OZC48358.1 carboxylesterase [Rhodococcus sp. 06-621-2]OZD15361.1 carboxylesterase [Rhodococcus sp. 06-156-4C]OZD19550.1 carboxylesterase [Rhodococcus sp. 06-156-4a]OZD23137.1 carboxylesterase [Rhodococcus sp. 06-156-3C]OZD25569.1 carboxylesterase [Rhodococcus sp. 06-156-3b]
MDVTVDIAQGTIRGQQSGPVTSFLGIPYAEAPFGARRFAAPSAPPSWSGVRDAVTFGATAPKIGYRPPVSDILTEPVVPGDECLNVNVWTPDVSASGLPVFVWIHGGAFVNGSNAVPIYDGSAFARDGIVVVTVNYRLGADGFARIDGAPANRGLLDQVAALRWVRDNIAAFGGDPNAVTVAGESAGAMSVGTLMSMPSAEGLFRRAILQSGAGYHVITEGTATKVAEALADSLGVQPDVNGFGSVPVEAFVDAQRELGDRVTAEAPTGAWGELAFNMMPFEPYVDGDVVPDVPHRRIAAGAGSEIDVLIGTTSEEFAFFLVPAGVVGYVDEARVRAAIGAYGADVEQTLDVYRAQLPDASPGELLIAVITDWFFRIPAVRVAETRGGNAFVYEFTWRSTLFDGALGACHALEIPFVFDLLDKPETARITGANPPQQVADDMHRAWVDFVRDGSPGWSRYGADRSVMMFGDRTEVVDDPRASTREVWAGVR